MPLYESVVIARQDLSAVQAELLADELTKIIEEGDGKVSRRENWGLRTLSYRMKKNRKGHYILFNVDAPAPTIKEYERRMRINEDVLRYLTVSVDEHEDGPSAMVQSRGRSGRREGGHFDSRRRAGDAQPKPANDKPEEGEKSDANAQTAAPQRAGNAQSKPGNNKPEEGGKSDANAQTAAPRRTGDAQSKPGNNKPEEGGKSDANAQTAAPEDPATEAGGDEA